MNNNSRRIVVTWLCVCSAMVFAMVMLGGAVRLTGSGLSMVDWKPLMGILPPIGEQAWQFAFDQYKQFPEYQLVNYQIGLDRFKFIYLMEYAHRVLGRVIGIVFFIPFIYFLVSQKLDKQLVPRLWFLFVLGALQGGVGWYMVKSGLVDNPAVSQYRLTLHLMVAVLIYAYLVRCIVGLVSLSWADSVSTLPTSNITQAGGYIVLGSVLLMIISGGFMAGTHAGFILNTFPTMGGVWIPDHLLAIQPGWRNFFENAVTIQFIHRSLALVVFILVSVFAVQFYRSNKAHNFKIALFLILALLVQLTLGVSTLVFRVPVALGVAHQGGALVLLTALLIATSRPFKIDAK